VARRAYPLVLLRGYEDFNRGQTVPHANFVADFELYQAAEVLGTVGTFHGPTALDQVIAELHEAFDDVRFAPEQIIRVNDLALAFVVRFMGVGRGSGVGVDRSIAHVWTRRDLQARRLEVHWDPADALEAVGLSE
jgi:ketosteroid isomerase-like protein